MLNTLSLIFIGSLTLTSYRSVPSQTDSTPFITSIGERVCKDGVAVSQDLLLSGTVKYGDWLYIDGVGLKKVNDTMNQRHKNHIDIWVESYDQEKAFQKRFKGGKRKVYIVRLP